MPRYDDSLIRKAQESDNNGLIAIIRDLQKRVNLLERNRLNIRTVDDLTNDLGLMQAGEFRAGNDIEPGEGFTGTRIAFPAMTYGTAEYHVAGVNNDTLQWGANSATGSLEAGAGAVTLDANGITIETGANNTNSITWSDGTNNTGTLYSYLSTDPIIQTNIVSGYNGFAGTSQINLYARSYDGASPRQTSIYIESSTSGFIALNNENLDSNVAIYGTSTDLFHADAGNNNIGIGTVTPSTDYKLHVNGGIFAENGNVRSFTATIADDAATSFTPSKDEGGMFVSVGGGNTVYAFVYYRVSTDTIQVYISGSNTNFTTGALNGTTGTDVRFTVSVNSADGKLYFENRRGAARDLFVLLF